MSPTWGGVLEEIQESAAAHNGVPLLDQIRRKHIAALHAYTGRNVILYASRWVQGMVTDSQAISIVDEDVHGLMEVVNGLKREAALDLILHSPGGSPDAAEMMVHYLRQKFDNIRVIVPQAAMSAATMLSCAADEIVMGAHSSLGPIDPQLITPMGAIPAQAILQQFERALNECADPKKLGAWAPMLPQYGPALLAQCENASGLAAELVATWLERWMFKGMPDAKTRAEKIALKLADHGSFKSHGRPVHRELARTLGFVVRDLEADQELQDKVLSVFHATMHVFSMNPSAAKLIENQRDRAFVKHQFLPMQQMQMQMIPTPPAPAAR
ncbi:hypothetical protein Strain138_000479 [Pseudogemmatithrix spongiicola]|uniref:Serine protease n=1 Tax=Pseudogemmatithrix spongiicola TaxID=3062599 RepID=A0AA49JSP9_9BACT|nr:hypothetical protein Strain138_000479 [Gemmatimonadaceae bacterium 'strain 138']WKW14153.1 hypothetical protein Strain318_000479 [Gemmatimonadaceae bacterium 'strain 318']